MTTVSTWRPQTGRELIEDRMPYGVWYTPDGSEWMFNRHYQVIAVRKGGVAREWYDRSFAVPDIMHQATRYLHNGNHMPWRAKYKRTAGDNAARSACVAMLRSWGLPEATLGK